MALSFKSYEEAACKLIETEQERVDEIIRDFNIYGSLFESDKTIINKNIGKIDILIKLCDMFPTDIDIQNHRVSLGINKETLVGILEGKFNNSYRKPVSADKFRGWY